MAKIKLGKGGTKIVILIYFLLILYFILNLFPGYWMLMASFKSDAHIYDIPPQWIAAPTLDQYLEIFKWASVPKYVKNSLMIALSVTAICVVVGCSAAWSLSRYHFPGGSLMLLLIVGTRMVPPISLVVPFYEIFGKLNLTDSILALVITYLFFNLPLSTWVIKNFFDAIPKDIFDASRVDGCTKLQIFSKIGLPLAIPGVMLAAILSFIFSWNEFMFALVLTREAAVTLPVGITDFFRDGFIIWNKISAATMISIIPAIIFTSLFQRYIIKGVTEGAVVG